MKQKTIDDLNLCLDDYFPKCDGTRTHPMKVSEILAIPEVKQAFKQELLRVLEEMEMVVKDMSHTEPCTCKYTKESKRFAECKRCVEMRWAERDKTVKHVKKAVGEL